MTLLGEHLDAHMYSELFRCHSSGYLTDYTKCTYYSKVDNSKTA